MATKHLYIDGREYYAMRGYVQSLLIILIVLFVPFSLGTNLTDEFLIENVTNVNNSQAVLLEEILSDNSTTDFDDFLDKEYGVYYELTDDAPQIEKPDIKQNSSSTFEEGSNLIIIEDNLSDFDSIYISVDEFATGDSDTKSISFLSGAQTIGVKTMGDIELTFGELVQSPLVDGANVVWTQLITLQNSGSAQDTTLNLWSHDDVLNRSFLWDVVKVSMMIDGEQISQTPIGIVTLNSNEVKQILISYETPAVILTKNCFELTVSDLLPSDAVVIESSIDLDVVVESICTGTIEYPLGSRYTGVEFV